VREIAVGGRAAAFEANPRVDSIFQPTDLLLVALCLKVAQPNNLSP
jgi:hypothetical protein